MSNERLFTREEVSSIVRKRVNRLNERIEELETENAALNHKLEEMEEDEKQKTDEGDGRGFASTLKRFSRRQFGRARRK